MYRFFSKLTNFWRQKDDNTNILQKLLTSKQDEIDKESLFYVRLIFSLKTTPGAVLEPEHKKKSESQPPGRVSQVRPIQ